MPGMPGTRFLEIVRAQFPTAGRILLSDHPSLEEAVYAFNNTGIDRYIPMPWDAEDVEFTITTLLSQREMNPCASPDLAGHPPPPSSEPSHLTAPDWHWRTRSCAKSNREHATASRRRCSAGYIARTSVPRDSLARATAPKVCVHLHASTSMS